MTPCYRIVSQKIGRFVILILLIHFYEKSLESYTRWFVFKLIQVKPFSICLDWVDKIPGTEPGDVVRGV